MIPSTTPTDIDDEWFLVLAWGVGSPRQVWPSFLCPCFIDRSSIFLQENNSYPSILKEIFLFQPLHSQLHIGVFLINCAFFSDEALLEAAANDVLNGLIDEAIRGQAFEIHRYVRYVQSSIH